LTWSPLKYWFRSLHYRLTIGSTPANRQKNKMARNQQVHHNQLVMMLILNEKYRLIEKISEGGSSSVYRAEEIGKGAVCAVKTLHRASRQAEEVIRFHQEVDLLAGISHPHIINIRERGVCDDGTGLHEPVHYLVLDYIEGRHLGDFIATHHLDIQQTLFIIEQVGGALSELHRHGIVHGDLKPENIMISQIKGAHHATLIDFSLSKIDRDRWHKDLTGTFFYMSPEKTGMIKGPVDGRSDLYALGVIGYRMLTQSFPFVGQNLTELLHSQVAVHPRPPSDLSPAVPRIVDAIVMKLLEKEPSRRYQSAEGLIPDLEKVRSGILNFLPGERDRRPEPDYRPQITGRDMELDRIYRQLNRLDKGDRVCLLAGEAGVGKTKILETLTQHARKKACLVLEGRCVERKNQIPWGLFQDLLADYLKVFSQYPDTQKDAICRAVQKESGDLGSIIIRLFPPARILLGTCPELVSLDLEKDKLRSLHAVLRFFLALIRAEGKMVIVLEDLQWVDSRSFSILDHLVKMLADYGVMFVGSYRGKEIDEIHPLNKLIEAVGQMKNAHLLTIAPLMQAQTRSLVKAVIKGKTARFERLSRFIYAKSRGNPLHILEVIQNLFQEKVLLRGDNALTFDEAGLERIQIPQSLQEIILQRINRLDATDIEILCDAAALGRRFATGRLIELEKTRGRSKQAVVFCLDKAQAHWILEKDTEVAEGRFAFAHDRIRDVFYQKIEPQQQAIHNRIGLLMESTYRQSSEKSDALFDLAHHFINAQNEAKILEYVYPAGLNAMEKYDYDLAVQYLTLIKGILEAHLSAKEDSAKRTLWYQCSKKLGEAMLMTGASETGVAMLTALVPFCDTPMEKAGLYFQACSVHATRGDRHWQHCEQHGKAGLALLGEILPVEEKDVKHCIARDLVRCFLQTLLPGILLRHRNPEKIARTRLIIEFYNAIARSVMLQNRYKFIHCSLRLLWLTKKRMGDPESLSIGYPMFVVFCVRNGFWRAANHYMEKAYALSIKSSNDAVIAQLLMVNGFFQQFRGNYLKSKDFFTRGIARFERIGDIGSSLYCRIGLIDMHTLQANHDNTLQLMTPFTQMVHKFGDIIGIAYALGRQAQLAYEKGDLDRAEKKALEGLDFSQTHKVQIAESVVCSLLGAIYLEKNQAEGAIEHLRQGMDIDRGKAFFSEYSVLNFPLYAEALIRVRSVNNDISLKQIKKSCKIALAKTRAWINHHGVSLRVYATYLSQVKQNRPAEKMFLKSIRVLETLGRKFELALSRRAYGYFLRKNGHIDAALSQFHQAWAIFDGLDSKFRDRIADYPGPGDPAKATAQQVAHIRKKETAFIPSEQLAAFGDIPELARYVLETAMKIAGAQGGCLFLLDSRTELLRLVSKSHMTGCDCIDYSQGIVDQVFESGRPVISVNASSDIRLNPYHSVSLKQLKSVICMPLPYEDRVSGVCYLFNQLSAGVFSDEEERLLKNFLFAAALHIENLRLKSSLEKIEAAPPDNRPGQGTIPTDAVLAYIQSHYTDNISRNTIASALNMDPILLGTDFKTAMGISIKQYINQLRLEHAYKLLLETREKIIDIAYESGFESLRTFNRVFVKVMGDTPSNYRKRCRSNRKAAARHEMLSQDS
jgi:serine/threonine protein kinase/AraC-like DNA-binding protein/tetratricopeptide (TPR) repeat protein